MNPNFAEIARVMGAQGIRVVNHEDIQPAFKELINANKPAVLEIMVSQDLAEPFRRDALRKPVRKLDKYKDLV